VYRTVEHQADIAVEIEATDRTGLFTSAMEALISMLTGEVGCLPCSDCSQVPISSSGFDDEERLVNILNELLFLCQVQGQFPVMVENVHFDDEQNVTTVVNVLEIGNNRTLKREIKAATYHNLKISKYPSWKTTVVFDV